MVAVALDIETCPLPVDRFSDVQASRHEKELTRRMDRHPESTEEEASRSARSLHPPLGWISCVSVVRGRLGSGHGDPHSWTASSPDEEEALLEEFWEAAGEANTRLSEAREDFVWTTFNGKDFDVPFLTARSARHGIEPTCQGLLNTYPYSQSPHADLQTIWGNAHNYGLEDLCSHLGVPNPKKGLKGSEVARAVAEGRMDEVKEYCERDAVATYRCLEAVQWVL